MRLPGFPTTKFASPEDAVDMLSRYLRLSRSHTVNLQLAERLLGDGADTIAEAYAASRGPRQGATGAHPARDLDTDFTLGLIDAFGGTCVNSISRPYRNLIDAAFGSL